MSRHGKQSPFPHKIIRWSEDWSETMLTIFELSGPYLWTHHGKIWINNLVLWPSRGQGLVFDGLEMAPGRSAIAQVLLTNHLCCHRK